MLRTRNKRILQITAPSFPPAIRVVKEGLSLLKVGYQMAVLCPPMKGRPEQEEWRGIRIFRPAMLQRATSIYDKLIYQTCFYSPAWFRSVKQVISEYKPDVIHVHNIWLGRTVFLAKSDQKIVMDLHENMPAAVVEYLTGYRGLFKWFNWVFKHHKRVLKYERALLEKSDKIFVVVDEALQRVLHDHQFYLRKENVVNIENLESKEFLNEKAIAERVIEDDHFSILYIGGFGPHRGIDTLIMAMKYIKAWGLNVRLHLVGARDSDYLEMLKNMISDIDVTDHVTVTGWVPAESVLAYIRQASVGAVPHHSNPHTNNTIPHKLYQYMIASTPVLVSTSPPLARTVRAAGAGVVFEAGNAQDCAEKIREMFNNPSQLQAYTANGFKYVMHDGHNWEDESAPILIDTYDRLLNIKT